MGPFTPAGSESKKANILFDICRFLLARLESAYSLILGARRIWQFYDN